MKPAAKSIILEDPSRFQFFTDGSGAHFLEVLCGGIGMFCVRIRMTEEEMGGYREFGDYFIEKLALDIAHAPNRFAERHVPLT